MRRTVPPMGEDFHERNLAGARFHRVDLTGATFDQVHLSGAQLRDVDLVGVRIRGAALKDVDINGEVESLRVNGVDVGPLIEAELDRRHPERTKLRPSDATGFREAWTVVEALWAETVDRARQLDPALLHESVDGEWSFTQTLRHLAFATDAWVRRALLGDPSPWDPLDLPWDEMPDTPGIPRDRDARPPLEEVLALRADRMATVRRVVDDLTDEQLAGSTEPAEGPGWPPEGERFPVREVLATILNEEWWHRQFAERDLDALTTRPPAEQPATDHSAPSQPAAEQPAAQQVGEPKREAAGVRSRTAGMWWGTAIEAPDPGALARFYSRLLGWQIGHEEPGTAILAPPQGSVFLVFQQARDYRPPVWPPADGEQRPMMHFDFQVGHLESAVAEALALGASLATAQPQDTVRVLIDPAGHPFCLCLDEG